jgi:ubiquinone/menaquinone biosynthesis C-methylase UbiE
LLPTPSLSTIVFYSRLKTVDMLHSSFVLLLAFPLARRELLTWSFGAGGAVLYGKIVSDAVQKLSRGDAYPELYEEKLESTISMAVAASIRPVEARSYLQRPFRLLEVGIGKECRIARRGMYRSAIVEAASRGVTRFEITGVDILSPSDRILEEARHVLQRIGTEQGLQIDFQFMPASIASNPFSDGYFDCVIDSLTLCSVDDQIAALREIRRIIRQDGGTFGFLEHVAVNPDEPYHFLELQQKALDPLQQAVADNCHLHRYTENAISQAFDLDSSMSSTKLFGERFLVEGMWPVSCQSRGVIQRRG